MLKAQPNNNNQPINQIITMSFGVCNIGISRMCDVGSLKHRKGKMEMHRCEVLIFYMEAYDNI